jgi:hypothetical protein
LPSLTMERLKTKIGLTKRYLKYLTKKYLKKNNLRDWLCVVAVCQAQPKANLCYQQIKLTTLVTLSFFDCDVRTLDKEIKMYVCFLLTHPATIFTHAKQPHGLKAEAIGKK